MPDHAPEISVYSSIDEVDQDQWSAVIRAATAPAFYDYAFVRAYERVPLQHTESFIYLIFGDPPVAVLPAYVQGTDDPAGYISGLGLPDRRPGDRILMTHVTHCYDTLIPARPECLTQELADQVCAALADVARQSRVKWFAFLNVDGTGTTASRLTAAGLMKFAMNTRFSKDVTAYPSAEDYVADIPSSKARRKFRTSLHQASRAGMTVSALDPVREAAGAVDLCRRTTARHGTAGYYPDHFGEFIALAGELVNITEVRIGGRLASAAISLCDATRFHLWAGGIDYEFTRGIDSSFPLMLRPAIEETIRTRRTTLEAGRSNARAKLRFRLEPIPLFAFVCRA
ncbi:MAG TPA: GNAT family N-acetyltransferase [Streptosporangiaceae bacterium]|nr:GNAT family N-acetyltransferase [Streptosporangiaceae bacterium]